MRTVSRVAIGVSVLIMLVMISGCCLFCPIEEVTCGDGTHETTGPDGDIICQADLDCGEGTHEQGTGTERECVPDLTCGEGTHEQGTGTERECKSDLSCGDGTLEQGTGTERECVPEEEPDPS